MKDYIIGIDVAKHDAVDNSILHIETIVPKQGDINSYFNKPVTLNNEVIGVIMNAIEIEQGYKLTMGIWVEKIRTTFEFFTNNSLSSIIIG